MAKSKRAAGVDQYDVQVAPQTPMLKTIVHQDQLSFQFSDRDFGGANTVGILHVWHIGQPLMQFSCFVVFIGIAATVSAADDTDAYVAAAKPFGQGCDQRRFPGAPGGQISDADDRHVHPNALADSTIEGSVSPLNRGAIPEAGNGQCETQHRRDRTPPRPVHDSSIVQNRRDPVDGDWANP
jgi:hypothetical protein